MLPCSILSITTANECLTIDIGFRKIERLMARNPGHCWGTLAAPHWSWTRGCSSVPLSHIVWLADQKTALRPPNPIYATSLTSCSLKVLNRSVFQYSPNLAQLS